MSNPQWGKNKEKTDTRNVYKALEELKNKQ